MPERDRSEYMRKYYQRNKSRINGKRLKRRKPYSHRSRNGNCLVCGMPIPKERKHTHYCSRECYQRAFQIPIEEFRRLLEPSPSQQMDA